jgi:signal transduction histidine kinase
MSSLAARHRTGRAVPLWRGPLALDTALAATCFALALGLEASGRFADHAGGGRSLDALGVVLSAASSWPLVVRRRWPLTVLVVIMVATSVLYGLDYSLGPPAGSAVAVFGVAAARDVRRDRVTLGVVGALVLGVVTVHVATRGAGPEILMGIAVWVGSWIAGDRTRLRRERIQVLEERAERAEREAERERRLAAAEERTRIARDLHDSAGHAINVILVQAGAARLLQDSDPRRSREALEIIEDVARETIGEIDRMVRALREEGPDGGGGTEPPGLAALGALAERYRAAGLPVRVSVRGERRQLPPGVDRAAYRILQESLTNAARHGTGAAGVDLEYGADGLAIAVTNPTAPDAPAHPERGHGIVGMRERAALLGGTLEAGASSGAFRVLARLPNGAAPGEARRG